MKIAVACGCGISSRFLVEKLKRYVQEKGMAIQFQAANEYELQAIEAEEILIGTPLLYQFDKIKNELRERKVSPVLYLIEKEDYERQDAGEILRKALMQYEGEKKYDGMRADL